MRRYSDILGSLLVREQLLLGWKMGFFIVCGALLVASLQLIEVNLNVTELSGTVVSQAASKVSNDSVPYLIVKLDNGETVRAGVDTGVEVRAGQRAIVRQTTTNIFGYKKYKMSRYLGQAKPE